MVAIMGMISEDGTFGTTGPKMWLPGSAFEKELGVQAVKSEDVPVAWRWWPSWVA